MSSTVTHGIDYDQLAAAIMRFNAGGGNPLGIVGQVRGGENESVVNGGVEKAGDASAVTSVEAARCASDGRQSPMVANGSGDDADSGDDYVDSHTDLAPVPSVQFAPADGTRFFYTGGGSAEHDRVSIGEAAEVESQSSVELVGAPPLGSEVQKVKFGGLSDTYTVEAVREAFQGAGFFKLARAPAAIALRDKIASFAGVKMPKAAQGDIAVCMYTAGTMPVVMVKGKERLRMLAALGDAAITMHIVMTEISRGNNVESMQSARSKWTSNPMLAKVLVGTGLSSHIVYAPGVNPETATTSATAFEAIVGVIALYRKSDAVVTFLRQCQL